MKRIVSRAARKIKSLGRRVEEPVHKVYSDSLDAIRKFDEAIYQNLENPQIGESTQELKLRRGQRPTLVDVGQQAAIGTSRVQYRGANLPLHLLTKDFFITMVQLNVWYLFLMTMGLFLVVMFFWSGWYYLVMQVHEGCFSGPHERYVDALLFSVVTQMTIGYGNTAPDSCWVATFLVLLQSVLGIIMDAVVLGIIFAKISHPHQRSRSIFISNKAIISRRDGILKFMFRVADIRNAQVVEPKLRTYLYTWGEGRITAENERVPVRVESIELDYIDGMLLLPLIIEHTIDERSPLCGHTHSSLVQMNAEIVVTFEGTTEMGNPFMTRRSYVPEEIFWGYQFKNVVVQPESPDGLYGVNLNNFHAIEPQKNIPNLSKLELSSLIVNRAKKTVPYPLLGENTLVLSDVLCVAPNKEGTLCLYCRVGDSYPNQMLEITAKMYLYRWADPSKGTTEKVSPQGESFEHVMLSCGYRTGADRIHLRLPTLISHEIDSKSPLRNWLTEGGLARDSNSEILVVINAYIITSGRNMLRQRTYSVSNHVKYGYGFVPMVKHPARSLDRKPRIRWQVFHDITKASGMEKFPEAPKISSDESISPSLFSAFAEEMSKGTASTYVPGLDRYRKDFGVSVTDHTRWKVLEEYANILSDTGTSLPPPVALHPAMPGIDRFREVDDLDRNDLTVQVSDLHRYSAAVGTDSIINQDNMRSYTALPSDFKETTAEAQNNASQEQSTKAASEYERGDNGTEEPEDSFGSDYDKEAGPIFFEKREGQQDRSLAAFADLLRQGENADGEHSESTDAGRSPFQSR